jgi:hypothetical protein
VDQRTEVALEPVEAGLGGHIRYAFGAQRSVQPLLLLELAPARDAGARVRLDAFALGASKRAVDEPRQQLEGALVRQLRHGESLPSAGNSFLSLARA